MTRTHKTRDARPWWSTRPMIQRANWPGGVSLEKEGSAKESDLRTVEESKTRGEERRSSAKEAVKKVTKRRLGKLE